MFDRSSDDPGVYWTLFRGFSFCAKSRTSEPPWTQNCLVFICCGEKLPAAVMLGSEDVASQLISTLWTAVNRFMSSAWIHGPGGRRQTHQRLKFESKVLKCLISFFLTTWRIWWTSSLDKPEEEELEAEPVELVQTWSVVFEDNPERLVDKLSRRLEEQEFILWEHVPELIIRLLQLTERSTTEPGPPEVQLFGSVGPLGPVKLDFDRVSNHQLNKKVRIKTGS